ncbi:hypothetical protein OIU34_20355 [Pararhizobium sp. BT-229]|uniref:hypothetical protein n=1 Tax=Pararhizobium sp. BT-229 TaxID=2986923 RepID=UPI0021F7E992|nr:hypothetical protein [Pararhizobium sp. BT-229]MCV9964241.1 hypothetical protein [Pararhizobium sp. BT-229]
MTSFNEIADRFGTAEIALNFATQRLVADKDRRKGSIVARLVDFVSETDAEEEERKAREEFDRIKEETIADVAGRLHKLAMSSLSEDPAEASRRAAQDALCKQARSVLEDVERLLELARDARDKLTTAASACSGASSMEMMDAFTSNKGISAMSSISTSNAKSSLNTAGEALRALSQALPKRSHDLGAEAPNDFLYLVLDFADFPIDFLSWMNMGALDTAEEKCKDASVHVAKVIDELVVVEDRRRQTYERENALLLEIDLPYLLTAAEYVPQAIRFAIPDHLASHGAGSSHGAGPRM